MVYKMKILRVNGTEEVLHQDTRPDLKQLQDIVHGLIEVVQLDLINFLNINKKMRQTPQMIINEEGRPLGLKRNENATRLYWETAINNGLKPVSFIVGDVVILENFKLT